MCVTNTTHRRIQAVTLNSNQLQVSPSVLSQRLLGSFPLSQLPAPCGGSLVATTAASNCEYPQLPPQYSIFSSGAAVQQQHESAKTRPKRRRKPQKPGKTAKLNDRHFVVHNYHDHSHDPDDADDEDQSSSYEDHHHHSSSFEHGDEGRRRGGVAVAFPLKLHAVLDQVERDGYSHVISWSPHGRCFVIHKPKQFTEEVMPKYFRQSKLTSFQRQLNLYGFSRLTRGPDAGGYYHELFLRNREYLCKRMTRTKVKGTKFKAASSPDSEPDFYTMPPVTNQVVTPHHSSDEEMSFDSSSAAARYNGSRSNPSVAAPVAPSMYSTFVQQQCPPPLSTLSFAAQGGMSNVVSSSSSSSSSSGSLSSSSDFALDSAVDELLLNELSDQDDFLSDLASWDATAFGGEAGVEMEDVQLGFMLEKLLEDL